MTLHPDGCDRCGNVAELYHNESTGLAFCADCDAQQDAEDALDARADGWPRALDVAARLEVRADRVGWLFSALRLELSETGLAVYAEAGQDSLMDFLNKSEDIYRARRDKAAKESA